MSEQQRLFAAIALSLGIFLVWQYFLVPPPPPRPASAPIATAPHVPEVPAPVTAPKVVSGTAGVVAPLDDERPAATPVPTEVVEEKQVSFETPLYRGTVSSRHGALVKLELARYLERAGDDGSRVPVSLVSAANATTQGEQATLELEVDGQRVEHLTLTSMAGKLTLTALRDEGLGVEVQITPRRDDYALDYAFVWRNGSTRPVSTNGALRFQLPVPADTSSMFAPQADVLGALCDVGGALERMHAKDLQEEAWKSPGPGRWGGLDRQYFVVAGSASDGQPVTCSAGADGTTMSLSILLGEQTVGAGEQRTRQLTLFAGPKRQQDLERVAVHLADSIEYDLWGLPLGFLARPMVFLLNLFHGWTTSWGMAIMLLTLVVKLLLFPVTYKSSVSMRRMQLLKPEMDKIKVRFEGDRERQQTELMKLYREKGVNPFGGCLPMLMQMPVWFALYRTLWTAVDLYQQSFLWVPDLTAKEPFPIMALVLGVLTFVQQKLTPTPDSQQAKVMLYVMPVMLTVFMIALPSGLVLYILINSVLTIAQQLVINRRQVSL